MRKTKFLKRLSAITLALTVLVTPVMAFAEGGEEVIAVEEDQVDVTYGDITATDEYEPGLVVDAADGHTADVTTGNITSAQDDGVYTWVSDNSEVTVNTGTIDAATKGVNTDTGLNSNTYVTTEGITSDEVGIQTFTGSFEFEDIEEGEDHSLTTIHVDGDVVADTGIVSGTKNGATTVIDIDGDVIADDTALDINTGEYSTTVVTVNGDAIGGDHAISEYASHGGENTIAVTGDVVGKDIGACLWGYGEDSTNNLIVEGTIKADKAAVITPERSKTKNVVTVWKIETGKDGYTAAKEVRNNDTDSYEFVEDEKAEKEIQYIIKVQQDENATLVATDADGNPLATVTGANGVLEYAHEGDKVLLKVDVADGYELDAAYGDAGQQLELVKDANGNYYINVPRNGGVQFSVKLSKVEKDKDDDDDKKDDKKVEGVTYTITDAQAVSVISSAAAGGTVSLSGLTGTSLSASVVAQLLARRDVTVTITYYINGVLYKTVIPAGADVAKLISADGSISFAALGQEFGSTKL